MPPVNQSTVNRIEGDIAMSQYLKVLEYDQRRMAIIFTIRHGGGEYRASPGNVNNDLSGIRVDVINTRTFLYCELGALVQNEWTVTTETAGEHYIIYEILENR